MRIILVADHASIDFGGEAALPCHYFRVLLSRNIDVHLVVHERSKKFLDVHFKNYPHNIHYTKDKVIHRWIYFFQKALPDRIGYLTFGFILRTLTQFQQKRIIRRYIIDKKNTIVHQVIPVSPKAPSLMYGFDVPVIFGPLNGGMTYPDAFSQYEGRFSSIFTHIGRRFSETIHYLLPGKRLAKIIMVANERTKQALPKNLKADIHHIVENGVDLSIWKNDKSQNTLSTLPKYVYVGRLVDWKAVDILLYAFFHACEKYGAMELHIIGDGGERKKLEDITSQHSASKGKVIFHGWLQQSAIAPVLNGARALVLPSLYECGGAVVLEAMASSLAVIATNWGGPADYLDKECGILISPLSRGDLIEGFSSAMIQLAKKPQLALQLGETGRKKIESLYDWEIKISHVLNIYQLLLTTKQ